jgi:FdhD protein
VKRDPSASVRAARVLRWQRGTKPARHADELAVEEPLEIRVDTRPVVVTMRTPGHDRELAAGFLLSEGLIRRRDDVLKIAPYVHSETANVVEVFLAPGVKVDFAQLTRHVYASSSCGLCGKASIAAVHQHFPKLAPTRWTVRASLLAGLPDRLRAGQETFDRTGGLHAAGVFDARGRLVVLREDVGRHNAVDKVLGHGLLTDALPFRRHVLAVSGRASFEILQKALAAHIAIVAAVSAPSSLAVEFARRSGQTLVGFLRGDRMNVYSHPDRLVFDAPSSPGRNLR